MKKLLCFALVVFLLTGLCGCDMFGSNEETASEQPQSTASTQPQITLSTYQVSLYVGNTIQLQGSIDSDITLLWKSSNENVAVVNSQGIVTAVNAGVGNIICYAEGATEAVCTVTVQGSQTVASQPAQTQTQTQQQTVVVSGNFIFPNSSYAYLTQQEVSATLANMSGYSPSGKYAQDAINEIYARNGYVFKNNTIAAYYNAQSWYTPNANFSTSALNKYEQKNIALLKKFL